MSSARLLRAFLLAFLVATWGLLWISSRIGGSDRLIGTDGKSYYAWVRSPWIDGDIQFVNDYALLYPPDPLPEEIHQFTPAGNVVNKYPIGLPLLELPGFFLGHLIAQVMPSGIADGISTPYQFAVTWSLAAFYVFSFWLLWRGMVEIGLHPGWSSLLCMMLLLGTNLLHYVSKEPAMAHGAGVAVFNAAVYLLGRKRERAPSDLARGRTFGLLAGLLFLIRNTNLFMLPVLVCVVRGRRSARWLAGAVTGFGLLAGLQPLTLYALWGEFRLVTYPYESFTSDFTGILKPLFSARHGLLVYHPWYLVLILLTAAACFDARSRRRPLAVSVLGAFLLLLVGNGLWPTWWFGVSFGNRAFIEAVAPLSLGAAAFLTQRFPSGRPSKLLFSGCAVVCLANLYLWAGFMMQRYPVGGDHTVSQVYFWLAR